MFACEWCSERDVDDYESICGYHYFLPVFLQAVSFVFSNIEAHASPPAAQIGARPFK